MQVMADAKNNEDKNKLEPREVSELLRNFYHAPEEEIQDFDDFYSSLQNKIENEQKNNHVSSQRRAIEDSYQQREEQLKAMLKKIDVSSEKKKPKRSRFFAKKLIAGLAIGVVVGLAAFASYHYQKNYNYIASSDNEIHWQELKLLPEQISALEAIETKWQDYKKSQETKIEKAKAKLDAELNKAKPNLALLDKYEREILDTQIALKRQKADIFLEKRFVLSEEQTMNLLKQLRENSN